MRTFLDCAPFLANLFLFSYEFRYDNFLKSHKHDIYPKELDLASDDKGPTLLGFRYLIVGKGFSYKIYNKRDNFDFPIVNYPDLSGNIPSRQSYSVFISQLVRYARGCLHLKIFNFDALA